MRLATVSGLMVFVFAVAPASAGESAETLDLAAVAAPAATPAAAGATQAGVCGRPDLAPALAAGAAGASTLGGCTATCWDGSTRTCTGSSCSAVDSSCPSQQGYCWSNSGGYSYCPPCGCQSQGNACTHDAQCGTCAGEPCRCTIASDGKKRCNCLQP
jgi:hypothetical protein